MSTDSKRVIIGCLGAVHGVRGWLKIHSYTDPITNILEYPNWQIQHKNQWRPLDVEDSKINNNTILIKIRDINDRDIAKTYTNDLIAINREALPEPGENEYYWSDLIGLNVTNTAGIMLGKIVEMRDTGANDIIIIQGEKRRHLVPYLNHVIQSIDLDKQQMIVDWDDDF